VVRREVQISHPAQQFPLLIAEVIAVVIRIECPIARFWRHSSQAPVSLRNLCSLVFGEVVVLLEQVARARLLLRRHVLESLHPVEDLRLLLWRLVVEVAQTVEQLVLPLRRKVAEARILF